MLWARKALDITLGLTGGPVGREYLRDESIVMQMESITEVRMDASTRWAKVQQFHCHQIEWPGDEGDDGDIGAWILALHSSQL